MLHKIFWCIASVLIITFSLASDETIFNKQSLVIALDVDDQQIDAIDAWIAQPINIDGIYLQSDSDCAQEELVYLIDMPHKGLITSNHIKKTCSLLKKKNKFKSVTFSLHSNQEGLMLSMEMQAYWVFNKIMLYGPLLGKDIYKQYYTLEGAEPFNIDKHYHCLADLKQILYDQGYCTAQVTDYLSYDNSKKMVTVHVVIDPGIRAIVDPVRIILHEVPQEQASKCSFMQRKIEQRLTKQLVRSYYDQQRCADQEIWIKKYLAKEGFFSPRIMCEKSIDQHNNTVILEINIWLGQQRRCVFEGNVFFSSKQLLNHILSFGQSAYLLPDTLLVEDLADKYREKGFWHCSIMSKQEQDCYYFKIQENERALIAKINFKGVTLDQQAIIEKCFSALKKHHYFDQELLDQSLSNLTNYYTAAGFAHMRIVKYHCTQIGENTYCLEVTIDEGIQNFCVRVEIPNFSYVLAMGPFKNMHKKLPAVLGARDIQEQRQWLMQHFQQQGYLYVGVKPSLCAREEGMVLRWDIDVQSPTVFGKTIIIGNTRFPFARIMQQLPYQEGQLWNKDKLEEAVVKLRELGIFETITIYPDSIEQVESKKAIIIKLIEDDPFEIRARLGFQQVSKNLTFRSGTTYKAGGSFLYKNPFNVGDYIRLDGDVTRFYRYASALYVSPWTFGLPLHTTLKGYSNKYTQPVRIGIDKPLYNAIQQGALLGLVHKFNKSFLGVNIGFECMETNGLSQEFARAINFQPTLVDQPVPYFFIEPNIFIDLLDNKLNPTRGSLTVCSFKGMFSWKKGSVNFFKFLCEQSIFIPMLPLVLGMRVRIGHIFNSDLSSIMPPERFFLGGENSLRGYEVDLAPPLGIITEDNGKRLLVPQGGKSMISGNVEMRFPFYKNIGGTIFQDFGILIEHSLAEITGNKFLAATGFGLRYNTPIGPLRFDLGFKWKRRDPEESSWAWFLTLGNAF